MSTSHAEPAPSVDPSGTAGQPERTGPGTPVPPAAPIATAAELRVTICVTALCSLLLEILLTRVLSVVMWYHFTFAVISVALLGIAAGALHCDRWIGTANLRGGGTFSFSGLASQVFSLFAVAVLLPIVLMMTWLQTPTFSVSGAVLLLCYFTACALPFYASGFLTALTFRCGTSSQVSVLYAADLVAGAAGCLLALPFLELLGGVGSLLSVSVLLAGTGAYLAWRAGLGRDLRVAGGTALVCLVGLVFQVSTARIDLETVKVGPREKHNPIFTSKWNSHSRLAVLDYYKPISETETEGSYPFLAWGLSDKYKGWLPHQYLITIDGGSETPITEMGPDLKKHEYLAWDVTSMPYHLRPAPKTLIIGAGGGRDLMTALWFGSTDVTGVELNRGIYDWMTSGRFAEFSGNVYTRPGVRVFVDDGRNFVRGSTDRFDVLQISMIDTFAATAAGAYALSENNLYTVEAFEEYLNHLKDDGILSINRFFLEPPQQTLRIVTIAREALTRLGVTDPAACMIVVRKDYVLGDNGLVMIKRTPFTPEEIKKATDVIASRGFTPIVMPGVPLRNRFTEFLSSPDPDAFYRSYPFNVRPSTDDLPFFFNTLKVESLANAFELRSKMEEFRRYNFDAVFILFVLLVMSVASLGFFVFVPLGWPRDVPLAGNPAAVWRALLYFVWVGLGYILVEVVLIQRYNLYLGHPVYSLAVILVSLLAFSGLGSAFTARWPDRAMRTAMPLACGAAILVVGLGEVIWPVLLHTTFGLPVAVRAGLAVLSLLPIGFVMGMPYPTGLRVISGAQPQELPWVWAVNASASVLGSILAFALAMALGFRLVLLLGAVCYLAALLCGVVFLLPLSPPGAPAAAGTKPDLVTPPAG